MRIEILDSTTPMLGVIARVSQDVAYEQMSKIGNTVRVNVGIRMRNHYTHWFQREGRNGKRIPFFNPSETKELGLRTNRNGNTIAPNSMSNFISSNLMEESGVLVVGGRNKRKTVIYRKDGQITGYGTLQAITKHTQSIINKLDTGERNEYHGWGKSGREKESMENFRNAKYQAANFMRDGFNDSTPYMTEQLTGVYEQIVGKAINRESVHVKLEKREIV